MTHERAAHVLGFLADFADAYPHLCEGGQAMYRDLARAALAAVQEQAWCEDLLIGREVERAMNQYVLGMVREDVRGG